MDNGKLRGILRRADETAENFTLGRRKPRDILAALVILYTSEILGMMGASLVRLLLRNTVAGTIVYLLCSTGVYLIAIYVLTGTYMKRVLGMPRREGMPGCKADTLVTWGVTTICLQGVILVLTVPSVDKDTHASSGLITAFPAPSSIGVRLVHLIPASLKLP